MQNISISSTPKLKVKFKMIVAMDLKNGIGKDNKLPWHYKEDLRYFSLMTKGQGNNAIIMGRKTHESIGKILPKRDNLILSSTLSTSLGVFSNLGTGSIGVSAVTGG